MKLTASQAITRGGVWWAKKIGGSANHSQAITRGGVWWANWKLCCAKRWNIVCILQGQKATIVALKTQSLSLFVITDDPFAVQRQWRHVRRRMHLCTFCSKKKKYIYYSKLQTFYSFIHSFTFIPAFPLESVTGKQDDSKYLTVNWNLR